jgi:hypothetical protein
VIAKIAYLTSPAPNRFILNYQEEGKDGIERVEITKAHLANILIDGCALALRETSVHHRVPETNKSENAEHERATSGA